MRLSARNQIPATVTAITAGEATANVELDAGGVRLVASITVEAARELKLATGTQVTAVIKASDVIIAVQLSSGGGDPPYPPMSASAGLIAKGAILSGPPTRTKGCARQHGSAHYSHPRNAATLTPIQGMRRRARSSGKPRARSQKPRPYRARGDTRKARVPLVPLMSVRAGPRGQSCGPRPSLKAAGRELPDRLSLRGRPCRCLIVTTYRSGPATDRCPRVATFGWLQRGSWPRRAARR